VRRFGLNRGGRDGDRPASPPDPGHRGCPENDWDLPAPGATTRRSGWNLSLEGIRFRNVYLTSRAIENGSANLFHHLYYNARISMGKVLHVSDYQETE
jgi:hypothetical protein